jgi:hypothetical protein
MAKAKRRTIHPSDIYVTNVDALTLRTVAGEGEKVELLIRTKFGTLAICLISRRGGCLRVTDLRARDKQRSKKSRFMSVPFSEIAEVG